MILDCVGGTYWEQNADVVAVDGQWVLYGLMGGPDVNGPILAKYVLEIFDKLWQMEFISSDVFYLLLFIYTCFQ